MNIRLDACVELSARGMSIDPRPVRTLDQARFERLVAWLDRQEIARQVEARRAA